MYMDGDLVNSKAKMDFVDKTRENLKCAISHCGIEELLLEG